MRSIRIMVLGVYIRGHHFGKPILDFLKDSLGFRAEEEKMLILHVDSKVIIRSRSYLTDGSVTIEPENFQSDPRFFIEGSPDDVKQILSRLYGFLGKRTEVLEEITEDPCNQTTLIS